MKKMYTFLVAGILTASSLPINNSYAVQTSEDLWDKFIKYDLCITDYDSLTDEEKELCKFIFETEQSSAGTVRCERARRTLAHDENIGERITLDDLNDCYGISDWYTDGFLDDQYYVHCVPDIMHLDSNKNYNEYWLDDKGTEFIAFSNKGSGMNSNFFHSMKSGKVEEIETKKGPTFKIETKDGNEYYVCDNYEEYDNCISYNGDYYYIMPDNNAVLVSSKYKMKSLNNTDNKITKPVIIPDMVEDHPVTAIYRNAFRNALITEVVLPETIEYINSFAFSCCFYLEKVNFPDSLKKIGNSAFRSTLIKSVDINNPDLVIADSAFTCNGLLTDANLNVRSIGESAFEDCFQLKNVSLGDSVEKISSRAFKCCSSIENINIPESLKFIGTGAFSGEIRLGNKLDGIKSITIPSTVEIIGVLPKQYGVGSSTGIEPPPASHPLIDEPECVFDPDCTINGWYGTEAHSYALANNLKLNPMDELLYGDANKDGEIGISDAVGLQNYLLRNETVGYEADLNKDGRIDSFDMVALRKMLIEN